MPLHVTTHSGASIPAISGYPQPFEGLMMTGAQSTTYVQRDGIFNVQELNHELFSVRHYTAQSPKMSLRIERNEEGMNSIAVLSRRYRHTIAGAGRFHVNNGYFSSCCSRDWESLIACERADPLRLMEIFWSRQLLERYLPEDSEWWKILTSYKNPYPTIIGYPFRLVTRHMMELISHFVYSPYDDTLKNIAIDHLLKEYLLDVLRESGNGDWLKGIITSPDLKKIEQAKQMIAANLYVHHYTVDIATSIGMNECKLKSLFREVTGMGTFDYLMYLRCVAVRDEIITTDLPLKAFIQKAGYRDFANFVTGFRRHMGISPAALRR